MQSSRLFKKSTRSPQQETNRHIKYSKFAVRQERLGGVELWIYTSLNSDLFREKDAGTAGMVGQNGETLSVHMADVSDWWSRSGLGAEPDTR